ncbi:MAG: helix-turn-helix domain-containing protein [Coriobacteriales bacterium]|nr:helix-turn-helix domain-containing protein [Coriobacteriales bacterium]
MGKHVALSEISETLREILQRTGSLQSLLQYGYSLLQNPLLVSDSSFGYIASAGTEKIDDEPIWSSTLENGTMPPEYIEALMQYDDAFSSTYGSDLYLKIDKDNMPGAVHSAWAVKLVYSGSVLGYLKLLEMDPVSEYDKEILLALSHFLSLAVGLDNRRSIFSPSVTETFFASVLLNRIKSTDEIRAYQKTFNVKLYEYLRIITIEVVNRKWHPDYLYYLLTTFKNYFSRSIVIPVNSLIVVLYDSREIGKAESPLFIERLTPVLERNKCHASISLPFTELNDIVQSYEQTLEGFKIGSKLYQHNPILYYQDLIEYHMILAFSRDHNLELLVHPSVRKLMEIDHAHEGDLTRTLFTYLDNQQNIAATARALSVHYNTLKYRVNRITEVVDIDFSDSDQMFRVALSKRVLELQGLKAIK